MSTTRRDVMRLAGAALALGAAGLPLAACAKQSQPQPNLALASYEGPDRAERFSPPRRKKAS